MKKQNATTIEPRYPVDGVATVKEAAEFLKVSTKAVYRAIERGNIKTYGREIGNVIRIPWKRLHEIAGTN